MKLPSGLPEAIADAEPILRLIVETGKFNSTGAKPAAFLPPQDSKTSTARHAGIPASEVIALAHDFGFSKPVIAAAVLSAGAIRAVLLDVEADEPPLRHANIIGWPSSRDEDEQRSLRKQLAELLVGASTLIRYA